TGAPLLQRSPAPIAAPAPSGSGAASTCRNPKGRAAAAARPAAPKASPGRRPAAPDTGSGRRPLPTPQPRPAPAAAASLGAPFAPVVVDAEPGQHAGAVERLGDEMAE